MSSIVAEDAEHARRLGEFAARRGLGPTSCPYRLSDERQRASASAWMRGYLAERPPKPRAVSYAD